MASFMDISPAAESVSVAGVEVEVVGISAKGLAVLFGRFPTLLKLFAGQASDLDVKEIASLGSDVVSAIIAAGCGYPGDRTAEDKASRLPLETQAALLAAIRRQTMPGGVENFMELLKQIGIDLADDTPPPSSNTPSGETNNAAQLDLSFQH